MGHIVRESSGVSSRARVIRALIGPGAYRSAVVTQIRRGNDFFDRSLGHHSELRRSSKGHLKARVSNKTDGRTFIGVHHVSR